MPYNLANMQLSEMTRLGAVLRSVTSGAYSLEDAAERVVELLQKELIRSDSGESACALVRFYMTVDYGRLPQDLQSFGARLIPGNKISPTTRCLTLLGTCGVEPAWCSRKRSVRHQTIPLPSEEVVNATPMVAQLLAQIGIPQAAVIPPDPAVVMELEQHTYNVFYVEEAQGNPFIPAQENFVIPYHIRSVLGFGGLLPSGDVYAVLMFAQVPIAKSVADIFRNAAMNLKLGLLPLLERPVFHET